MRATTRILFSALCLGLLGGPSVAGAAPAPAASRPAGPLSAGYSAAEPSAAGPSAAGPWSPAGKTFMTRDEALALAFPKCEVERSTAFLTETSQKAIAKLSKEEFKASMVYPYRATKDGKWVGTAYFDTHRVRTLRETVMIVVKPNATIERIELLSFAEPQDYIPRSAWYAQFVDKKLDDQLYLKRKIRGVTGATLTTQATTKCARRVLALHAELERLKAEAERAKKRKKVPTVTGAKKSTSSGEKGSKGKAG